MKAARQHVEQEAAHELVGTERHGLAARSARGPVILPAEGDAVLVQGNQALVRDRHPVRVTGEVSEHRSRSCKWAFGIDHPFALSQRREPVGEGRCVSQMSVLAKELQPAGAMCLMELFE